jgi:uncharacterized protein (TIGR03086 family)
VFPDFTPRPHLVATAAAPQDELVAAAAHHLDAPVPCEGWTVRDLVEHMMTWTPVLAGAGRGAPPEPGAPKAEGDWPVTLDAAREDLVAVWSDPRSWEGTTTMVSSELPASVVGTMSLCELVLHSWEEVHEALSQLTPLGRGMGAFAPAVDVAPDAPLLDRVVAVAGRDPAWKP